MEQNFLKKIRRAASLFSFGVGALFLQQNGCVIQGAGATPIQEALQNQDSISPKRLWQIVMKDVGPYNRTRSCWAYIHGGMAFCMRPMKYQSVELGSKRYYLFVVLEGEGNMDPAADSETRGSTIFVRYASSLDGSGLMRDDVSETFDLGTTHGSPDENAYELVKVGPASYAWKLAFGFTNTGQDTSWVTMFYAVGQNGTRQRKLADFITASSNESGCPETQKNCYQREIIWVLSDPVMDDLYSIQMHLRERIGSPEIFSGGKPIKDHATKAVIISYSATKGGYDLPGDRDSNLIDWFMRQNKSH